MSEIEELLKIIESFRKKNHYHVEEDTWYSCPAHPEYSGNDPRDCLCGLLEHNLKVDKALQIVRGLTPRALDEAYCTCENPDVYINRICQICGKPHALRQ